jgi:two-component system phosphate regulon sensor histidine kinase PhoR
MSHSLEAQASTNHRVVTWVVPVTSALTVAAIVAGSVAGVAGQAFDFTWRPFGYVLAAAIVLNVVTLFLMVTRSSYRKGSFYWLIAILVADILYLTLYLGQVSGATPEAAVFWQGILPLAWIPLPVCVLFFALCYVDDTDMPKNLSVWLSALVSAVVLVFIAGATEFIEPHSPNHPKLLPWGWQSEPGILEPIAFIWVAVVSTTALFVLIKAYRRSVDKTARKQMMIFIAGYGQYMAISFSLDLIYFSLHPNGLPAASFASFTGLSLLLSFGIFKYGLFQITPTSLASPILENLSEAVLGVNRDLRVEFANQGAENIFGHQKAFIRGTSLKELFRAKDYPVIEKGISQTEGIFTLEDITIKTLQDERTVPVTLSVSRATNERGKEVGYIMVVQNVTELKKKSVELAREKASVERKVVERTKELREERARLSASIESLTLGFALVDDRSNVVIQNKTLQSILQMKSPAGSVAELNSYMGSYDLAEKCRESQRRGKTLPTSELAVGSLILKVFMTPVMVDDEHGGHKALGSVVLIENITEAKVLERSRDEFFSIASHELRTPLTAIRGNTSMMLDYYARELKNHDLKRMLQDVHDSSTSLIAIVSDFLDMSRLEQGKMNFDMESFAVKPVIEKMAAELQTVFQQKQLKLVVDSAELDGLPAVYADRKRLQQVLYNVIGNALKFTKKGSVSIRVQVQDGVVKVLVSDTGRGIAVDAQKMLFHKFQQAGDSLLTRDTSRGTGMGLYIAKLMVQSMGGMIGLEASEVGKGSTFSFTVPVATNQQRVKAGLSATPAAGSPK